MGVLFPQFPSPVKVLIAKNGSVAIVFLHQIAYLGVSGCYTFTIHCAAAAAFRVVAQRTRGRLPCKTMLLGKVSPA